MTPPVRHTRRNLEYVLLGAASGVLAGLSSYVFTELLTWVTDARVDHGWLVWLLPLFGLVVGLVYHTVGGRAVGGTALAVSQAHAYTEGSPRRMAPLILGGTLLGQLGGASIGREGTAVQMSSSLTETGARLLGLDHDHRATLARASLAGGFGAMFGVPAAGVVFALEVARRRTVRALLSAVPAAFVGYAVMRLFGHHEGRLRVVVPFGPLDVVRLAAFAVVVGLVARAFIAAVPALKRVVARVLVWAPVRPVVGGLATLALMGLAGRDYLGLSLPLFDAALAGDADWWDPVAKFAFTVLALGTGFVGGEVTPLFVIGATLGAAAAAPLGLPAAAAAALGAVAVFGSAAGVPLACAVMAVELFGPRVWIGALLVCLLADLVSGREAIYDHPLNERAEELEQVGHAARGSDPRST